MGAGQEAGREDEQVELERHHGRGGGASVHERARGRLHQQVQAAATAIATKLAAQDRKSTRLNSSHITRSRMPSSA